MRTTPVRMTALTAILALGLTACPADDDETPAETPDEPGAVQFDVGVTEEPCPEALNPDNGCIYLGTLSDLTVGPFAAFGSEILDGQERFWERVNEQGGIGGLFDVSMDEHVEDTEYNPENQVTSYQAIVGDVAALTQTLGTPQTLAIADQMEADSVVGAVLTWWSGWELERYDAILQSGSNYCVDTMNGVEWAQGELGVQSVMTAYFPGDYGGDATAGAAIAAAELGLDLVEEYQQIPVSLGGDVTGAVQAILTNAPDLVVLTVGPTETAQIVGGAAAQGFAGRFLLTHPGYADALLETPAGQALLGLAHVTGPHENFGGESAAHAAMQDALGEGERPGNDGFTYGWVAAYPVLSVLEHAVAQGDLSRAGIRAAVTEVTVDYEGALPDKSYGGDPNETVLRSTVIMQPDSDATLGLTTVENRFMGSVAEGFAFTDACQPIG